MIRQWPVQLLQRLFPGLRFSHVVTRAPERKAEHLPDLGLVFDKQDGVRGHNRIAVTFDSRRRQYIGCM